MTHHVKLIVLLLSVPNLIGLFVAAILVLRADKERKKRNARLAFTASSHMRATSLEITAFVRSTKPRDKSLIGIAGRIFGFDAANLDRYPVSWWIVVVVSFVVSKVAQGVLANMVGSLAILVIPLGGIGFSRFFFGWFDRRRRERMLTQFPDALAMIVRSVRVGIPVQEAIRIVARESQQPTGSEFARLVSQLSVGVTLEDAINEMAQSAGLPEYRFFATALSLQNQTGGALSDTLESLADLIRKRVALKGKAKAMTAEAKASAGILGGLPVVTGLALWILNPDYLSLLFTDPTGHTLLGSSVLSLATGLFIIRTMIIRSLPI